jgi:hypothetical protein
MKQLLIYDRPVVLNRARHRTLRIAALEGNFHFAAALNSLPLAACEFARAACDHPILFAGADAGSVVPAALLGLRAGENLAVDADGRWLEDSYIPAFLRRYPFVLAEKDAAGDGEDFHVCLDEAYPGLGEQDGEALFDDAGANSPLLEGAMRFLQEYQAHLKRTRALTTRLHELDLLVPKVVQVQPAAGNGFSLDGLFVVDETRLRALKGRVLQDLLRSGDLGWIHIHLMSLVNVERLCRRLDVRMRAQPAAH